MSRVNLASLLVLSLYVLYDGADLMKALSVLSNYVLLYITTIPNNELSEYPPDEDASFVEEHYITSSYHCLLGIFFLCTLTTSLGFPPLDTIFRDVKAAGPYLRADFVKPGRQAPLGFCTVQYLLD